MDVTTHILCDIPVREHVICLRNILLGVTFLTGILLACSHEPEHGLISLLDQVDDSQVVSPWEIVLNENRLDAMAGSGRGLRAKGSGTGATLLQLEAESSIRLPIVVSEKRRVVIHVAYRKGKLLRGEVEARLVDGQELVGAQIKPLRGRTVDFVIDAETAGAFWISLLHRVPIGTRLPVLSIVAGTTAIGTDRRATEQLILLERWFGRDPFSAPGGLPVSRRLRLQLEGCTRDCILLGEADTLVTQLPRDGASRVLRFRHFLLQSMSERNPLLQLETWDSGKWTFVGQWHLGLEHGWSLTEVPSHHIPTGSDSIRFSLAGPVALVAVAEPVLIPTGQIIGRKNLLIVDLDTVRADRLGLYGYKTRPTSVALDSIVQAKGFAVFSNAFSAAPRTAESTGRFFTSKYRLGEDGRSYSTTAETLAEILRRDGYYCLAYTGGGRMLVHGLERGFHDYYWSRSIGKVDDTFPQAAEWLRDPLAPFFMFLHTYEAHRPYTRTTFCADMTTGRLKDPTKERDFLLPPLTIRSALTSQESLYVEALYDGGVRKACDATADFFTYMDTLGLWENTIVVVLSDHGEEFWDHLDVFAAHGHSLYSELLDVPFLVYSPEYASFQTIDEAVSLVDLVPTVQDLLGLPMSTDVDGVSVAPLLRDGGIQRPTPILAQVTDRVYREAVCVYDDDMKYVKTTYDVGRRDVKRIDRFPYPPPGMEMYAVYDDVREKTNIADSVPDLAQALGETLRSAQHRIEAPAALGEGGASSLVSPDLKAQLEALGYME